MQLSILGSIMKQGGLPVISKVSLIVSVVLLSCFSASATSCSQTGSNSTVSWQWYGAQNYPINGTSSCSAALTTSHDGVYYPTNQTTIQAGYKINLKQTGTWNVLTDSAGAGSNPHSWNGWHGGSLSNLYVCSGATCVSNPGAGNTTSGFPE